MLRQIIQSEFLVSLFMLQSPRTSPTQTSGSLYFCLSFIGGRDGHVEDIYNLSTLELIRDFDGHFAQRSEDLERRPSQVEAIARALRALVRDHGGNALAIVCLKFERFSPEWQRANARSKTIACPQRAPSSKSAGERATARSESWMTVPHAPTVFVAVKIVAEVIAFTLGGQAWSVIATTMATSAARDAIDFLNCIGAEILDAKRPEWKRLLYFALSL
jgi:hypothetical protein